MAKLDSKAVALALAAISGIGYVLCVILFVVAPQLTFALYTGMFPGVDFAKIARTLVPLQETVVGFVGTVVFAIVFGWLFAVFYNYLSKET